MGLMENRVAIRWSRAANMPMRSCRFRVGWPARMPANGEAESISALVRSRSSSSWAGGGGGEMSLINDEDDAAVPLGGLGGEQVAGLGHQLGFEVARLGAERPDDRHIQPPGAERRVGDVDDLVAGRVEAGDGGAQRYGLARADVPGDHPERGLDHAEADPGDRLGVRGPGEQVPGGDGLAERGAGQAEVRGPRRGAHRCSSSWPGSPEVSMASWAKSILAPVPAASSCAAATSPG